MSTGSVILLFFAVTLLLLSSGFFNAPKQFHKRNQKFLQSSKKYSATLVEELNERVSDNSMGDGIDKPIGKSSIFVGKSTQISNSGIVKIRGFEHYMRCTFSRLATKKNYPDTFSVYVGPDPDDNTKYCCYAEDYFSGSNLLTLISLCSGGVGLILLIVALTGIF